MIRCPSDGRHPVNMVVVGVKKKSNLTVRFSGTSTGKCSDRHGIAKNDGKRQPKMPSDDMFTLSYTWVISIVILLISIAVLTYRGYLDTHAVNYPLQGPKVLQKNSQTDYPLWGTYRPGMYFGLRTKEPLDVGSVSSGIMWYTQNDLLTTGSIDKIRYMCDNSHEDLVYGYVEHDTENYGNQVINDGKNNGFTLKTVFLRPNSDENDKTSSNTDWTTRITYETNNSASTVSLIWYVYIESEEKNQLLNNNGYFLDILQDKSNKPDSSIATIMGSTPSLGDFQMSIIPTASKNTDHLNKLTMHVNITTISVSCLNAALLKQCIFKTMGIRQMTKGSNPQIVLVNNISDKHEQSRPKPKLFKNLVAIQITITHSQKTSEFKDFSYSLDIAYTQKNKQSVLENKSPLIGENFDSVCKDYSNKFHQRFQKYFPIKINGNTNESQLLLDFAKTTFSNMAGSIGYFYGCSLVRDDNKNVNNDLSNVVKYWKAELLTVVPSRSQFPRGFLWDDGFHGLVLGSWSIRLQLNILGHWMDLLNHEGWIPREQILGSEAKFRVPEEFIIQSSRAANPPALLLTVDLLLKRIKKQRWAEYEITSNDEKLDFNEIDDTLKRLYPRLKAWYAWFDRSQRAINTYTTHSTLSNANENHPDKKFVGYRWRGRDSITNKELNPKTLTSGMDDYPRSSHPVKDDGTSNLHLDSSLNSEINFDVSERHVDLHCWMAHGARVLNNLHNYLYPSDIAHLNNKYATHFWMLVDSLDRLHWTEENTTSENSTSNTPMYADYGIHTDDVKLIKIQGVQDAIRVVGPENPPRWRFVNSHIGYNALYPMFFQLIKSSQRLNAILDLIEGIDINGTKGHGLLTKSCGLRSLSKSSSLYKVRNTMNDPPYWRGSIWINMQYLACSSLNYYANLPEATDSLHTNNKYLQPIQYLDLKTKQRCKRLYDKIRNDVIQCVYQEWKRTGFVFEQYDDDPESDNTFGSYHKGQGTRPFTGWSANVILLMAEIY